MHTDTSISQHVSLLFIPRRETVPPETVIVPILVSIVAFPVLAAAIICLLRHYNRRARAKDKFRYVRKRLATPAKNISFFLMNWKKNVGCMKCTD